MKTNEQSAIPSPRIRNNTGRKTGRFGMAVRATDRAFSHGESAVPTTINDPKIAIMIRGNPNTSMNTLEIVN